MYSMSPDNKIERDPQQIPEVRTLRTDTAITKYVVRGDTVGLFTLTKQCMSSLTFGSAYEPGHYSLSESGNIIQSLGYELFPDGSAKLFTDNPDSLKRRG